MKACDSCEEFVSFKNIYSNAFSKWQDNLEIDVIQRVFRRLTNRMECAVPEFADCHLLIKTEPNEKIVYWASETSPEKNFQRDFKHAKSVYKKMRNLGLKTSDSLGNVELYLRVPSIYYTYLKGRKKFWPRHLHFFLWRPNSMDVDIKTAIVLPRISLETFARAIRSRNCLVLCAIPLENPIGGTFVIPYKSPKRDLRISIREAANQKDVDPRECPIFVYCANRACHAAEILCEQLCKLGFVNLSYFPGGLEEWKAYQASSI